MSYICKGSDKQKFIDFCEKNDNIPIFHEPWWMDVICGSDNWETYLVGNGNDIKASFVYEIGQTDKGKTIHRSLLTQNSGLWISYPQGQGIISKQKYEEKIADEICDHIESLGLSRYDQQYNYAYNNFMPFFWRYYSGQVKYTYVIDDTSDMEMVRSQYDSKLKNQLRKAQKEIEVATIDDLEEFYRVNKLTFDRQGIEIPYSYEKFKDIYEACRQRDRVKLLAAKDPSGRVHSVAMLVWDRGSVYFLLNGTDPDLKQHQANLLLIDKSVEVAHDLGLKFDFEGSVIRAVNHCFREFAGTPMPYFRITKDFTV